jgi:hypothetical protein
MEVVSDSGLCTANGITHRKLDCIQGFSKDIYLLHTKRHITTYEIMKIVNIRDGVSPGWE